MCVCEKAKGEKIPKIMPFNAACMLKRMDEKGGRYSYEHALSNWFEDAVPQIKKKAYKGLELTLWVPAVGGDPYLET